MTEPPRDFCIEEVVHAHRAWRGPLLPILHAVQARLGYVPFDAVDIIARELNLSVAEVHGVVSFYRDFRSAPPAPTHVRICRGEACQSVGAHSLVTHAAQLCETQLGSTSPDGQVSLDEVFCLGNCALGPSVQVDGQLYGRVTEPVLDRLLGSVVNRGAVTQVGVTR